MWSSSVHGLRYDGVAAAAAVLRCIVRAGGEPVIMFPGTGGSAAEQLARLDGVVLPGRGRRGAVVVRSRARRALLAHRL